MVGASATSALPCSHFSFLPSPFLFLLCSSGYPVPPPACGRPLIRRRSCFTSIFWYTIPSSSLFDSIWTSHASLSWPSTIRRCFFLRLFFSLALPRLYLPAQTARERFTAASSCLRPSLLLRRLTGHNPDHLVVLLHRELPTTGFSCAVH